MEEVINNIRLNIIEIRKSMGLTQEQICQNLNKSQAAYARIESGKSVIDLPFLVAFADNAKMSICDIISYPHKVVTSVSKDKNQIDATLIVTLKNEKKDKVMELVFGDNYIDKFL